MRRLHRSSTRLAARRYPEMIASFLGEPRDMPPRPFGSMSARWRATNYAVVDSVGKMSAFHNVNDRNGS